MALFNNDLFIISFISTIYLIILMIISPIIDHFFTPLDVSKNENKFKILFEISLHIIMIAIVWHTINIYIPKYIEKILKFKLNNVTKTGIEIVSSIVLVGLQKNLIDKLEYITLTHPIRYRDFHFEYLW